MVHAIEVTFSRSNSRTPFRKDVSMRKLVLPIAYRLEASTPIEDQRRLKLAASARSMFQAPVENYSWSPRRRTSQNNYNDVSKKVKTIIRCKTFTLTSKSNNRGSSAEPQLRLARIALHKLEHTLCPPWKQLTEPRSDRDKTLKKSLSSSVE